eukprot:gene17315-19048_t
MTLPALLNKTWFQIVGATPEQLTALGFLAFLPLQPSSAFINLLNTSTLLQQQTSYTPIINQATTLNKNYNYSLSTYFTTGLYLDTSSTTVQVLPFLPVGKSSIANFFGTTDADLRNRRYLTQVYPTLKNKLKEILNKTKSAYYTSLPNQNMSFQSFKSWMGPKNFEAIEIKRMQYAKTLVDVNIAAIREIGMALGATIADVAVRRVKTLTNAINLTLKDASVNCSIQLGTLVNLTMANILHKCINVPADFDMAKFFPTSVALGKNFAYGMKIGQMASFLNMSLDEFAQFSMLAILNNISAYSKSNQAYSVAYTASRGGIKYSSLANMNLLEFLRRARIIPDPAYSLNQSVIMRLEGTTFRTLLPWLRSNMHSNLTQNGLYTLPLPVILKMFIFDTKGILKSGLRTGLYHLSYFLKLGQVRQMYDISPTFFNQQTMFSLAHHVSGIGTAEFANLFKISSQNMTLLGKASVEDLRYLVRLSASKTPADSMTPEKLSNFLFMQPVKVTRMLENLEYASLVARVGMQNLTIAYLEKIGNWNRSEVIRVLTAAGASIQHYDEIKAVKFSVLSRIIHTPIHMMGKFNMIKLMKSLCSTGKRFVNDTCTAFVGCGSAGPSTCIANAKCVDIIGSYVCRCKAGFAGDGTICYDACQTAKCPSEASCLNVPSKGAVCRCKKPTQVLRNGKCVTKKVKLFKVSGMKFKQKYSEKYKDKSSNEYKSKVVELETALYDAVCKKIPSCVGIKVTAITKGSIKVEYNVMVEANADNVTQSTVQTASTEALKDPSLSLLNPDQNSTLSAQVSDICQSGHDCGINSKCISIGDGNYKCECNKGYTMNGGSCAKDDASKDKDIVKIVVPIVVILVVIPFIIAIICVMRRKKKTKSLDTYKGNQSDVGFELGKSNAGVDYKR